MTVNILISRDKESKNIKTTFALFILFSMIFIPISSYGQIQFTGKTILSNGTDSSVEAQIVADGSNIYVVWEDGNDVLFSKSTNNGATFANPINLSGSNSTKSLGPHMDVAGNNVYVVWAEDPGFNGNILFRKSSDGGSSFAGNPVNVSNSTGVFSLFPKIAADVNNVILKWREGSDVVVTSSNDTGTTFANAVNLSNSGTILDAFQEIAVNGNFVYVAWRESGDIFVSVSSDTGSMFGAPINVSNTGKATAEVPRIGLNGDKVYIVWSDLSQGNGDIFFAKSIDNGATFDASGPFNISNNSGVSSNPDISDGDLFVVWQDNTSGNNEILAKTLIDSENNFSSEINISSNPGSSETPKISSGDNIGIVWKDNDPEPNGDILFKSRQNFNGSAYATVQNEVVFDFDTGDAFSISTWIRPDSSIVTPAAIVHKSDEIISPSTGGYGLLYIPALDRIEFVVSDDNLSKYFVGSTGTVQADDWTHVVSTYDGSGNRSGMKLYVNGALVNTGNPLAITGTILNDQNLVLGAESDGGREFKGQMDNFRIYNRLLNSTEISNLFSENASVPSDSIVELLFEDSLKDTSNSNDAISVGPSVFQDNKPRLGRAYDFNAAIFGQTINLSNNAGFSNKPQIATSGGNVFVVWQDDDSDIEDILFNVGMPSSVSILFDNGSYRFGDSAKITVIDSNANQDPSSVESMTIDVVSDTDGTGITISLDETGSNTGIFSGTITISESSSSGTNLQTSHGDTITATVSTGEQGFSKTFPITVALDKTGYNINTGIAHITVTDQHSNRDPFVAESVSINISTTADSTGIQLTLKETDVDTGIFGGDINSELIFMWRNNQYPNSGTFTITQSDLDANTNDTLIDVLDLKVTSDTDMTGIIVELLETNTNSSSFTGKLTLSSTASVNGSAIQVSNGDVLTTKYTIESIDRGIINPNPDPSRGAIFADVTKIIGNSTDTVTVTYQDVQDSAEISATGGGGGGGGSIVAPTLVLDAIGAIAIFGGGGGAGPSAPIIGSASISEVISGTESGVSEDKIFESKDSIREIHPNEETSFRFELYENQGKNNLQHATLYLNGNEREDLLNSDTYIRYDRGQKSLEIQDKDELISSADFKVTGYEDDPVNMVLEFDVTFSDVMKKSDLLLVVWDLDRYSSEILLEDAIKVIIPSESEDINTENAIIKEPEKTITKPEVTIQVPEETAREDDTTGIPPWVKTTASWWANNEIKDGDFVMGMQHLVEKDILKVPEITETKQIGQQDVPTWIKTNTKWWANDMISDDDFITGIQWLIKNGIMKV